VELLLKMSLSFIMPLDCVLQCLGVYNPYDLMGKDKSVKIHNSFSSRLQNEFSHLPDTVCVLQI